MKKYLLVAVVAIGSITVSCTADYDVIPVSDSNSAIQEFDYSLMARDGDSLSEGDTGGQGGSTPIKPPRP